MGKKIRVEVTIVLMLLSVWATGCEMKNNAGNIALTASGAGAEGAATGSAAGTDSDFASRYPFCNDWNLYTGLEGKPTFEQRSLRGEKQGEFTCPDMERYMEMVLVTNREILYIDYLTDGGMMELFSIPLAGKDHRPQVDRIRRILTTETGYTLAPGDIYADSRYVAMGLYCRGTLNVYREYDRQSNRKISIDGTETGKQRIYEAMGPWPLRNTVLLYSDTVKDEDGSYEEVKGRFYWHVVGSGKVEEIAWARGIHDTVCVPVICEDGYMYYCISGAGKGVYRLDLRTGEQREILPLSRLREAADSEREITVVSLWIANARLYVNCEATDKNAETDKEICFKFSWPLNDWDSPPLPGAGEGKMKARSNVEKILENDLFYLDSTTPVVGSKVLTCERGNGYCYDFADNSLKKLNKDDKDRWLWYYNNRMEYACQKDGEFWLFE